MSTHAIEKGARQKREAYRKGNHLFGSINLIRLVHSVGVDVYAGAVVSDDEVISLCGLAVVISEAEAIVVRFVFWSLR